VSHDLSDWLAQLSTLDDFGADLAENVVAELERGIHPAVLSYVLLEALVFVIAAQPAHEQAQIAVATAEKMVAMVAARGTSH
jgi:hypothetical protein